MGNRQCVAEQKRSASPAMSTGMEMVLLRVGTVAPSFPCSPPAHTANHRRTIQQATKHKPNTGGEWPRPFLISPPLTLDSARFYSCIHSFFFFLPTCSFALNGSFPVLLRHRQAAKALAVSDGTGASWVRRWRRQT